MKVMARLAWVETKLFLREPLALIFAFALPFFMLFILLGVFGNDVDTSDPESLEVWRGVGPADYYVATYVGLVMASAGLVTLPLRLAGYRDAGVLRRFQAAGVAAGAILGAEVIVALGMSIIAATGIVIVATLFYGTVLPADWGLVLAGCAVGMLAFAAIGLLLGAVLPSARAVQGAGIALFFVMMMVSGSGPPRGVLTTTMRSISDILPLTHVNLMLQDPGWGSAGTWATRSRASASASFRACSRCASSAGSSEFRRRGRCGSSSASPHRSRRTSPR